MFKPIPIKIYYGDCDKSFELYYSFVDCFKFKYEW